MSSEASNDFFWQNIPVTTMDNNMLQIQHLNSQMQVQLPQSESSSPSSVIGASGENINNNNRPASRLSNVPSTSDSPIDLMQQSILPAGVVNPDAIIPQSRTYTCRICQVTFPNKSEVTVHSRIHTNHEGKPYRCNFCGKGFSTNFYLKQHERIHNGQKPYKCPMCERSFKQLSHVQQHVRTHTGVRPYKCHWPGCGKAFLQQSHLKSHIARHSPKPNNGLRPYKCHWPDCEKSFAQISNLKSHVARHTPKTQKNRKESNEQKKDLLEGMVLDQDLEDSMDSESYSLVSPDVIGQAAAAANIVPELDNETIRPYLCPGCSKLYVREATFKKHLEECKTKLQMSISATAAALGIDPPPLPPPNSHMTGFQSDIGGLPVDVTIAAASSPQSTKKQRKREKTNQISKLELQQFEQHQQPQIIVEMPLDVNLDQCSPQMSDQSLNDINVKQEVLNIPLDVGSSQGNVMFKLPQLLNAGNDLFCTSSSPHTMTINNQNSLYVPVSANPQQSSTSLINNSLGNRQQQLVTSSSFGNSNSPSLPITIPIVATQSLSSSSQSVMFSDASSADIDDGKAVGGAGQVRQDASLASHSTINQAALRWQWDQPVPRLNFP